jgi:hypothetical protein
MTRGQDNNYKAKQQKQEKNNPLSQLVVFCKVLVRYAVASTRVALFSCEGVFVTFLCSFLLFSCSVHQARQDTTRQDKLITFQAQSGSYKLQNASARGTEGGTGQDRNDQSGRRGHTARAIHARNFATQVWITMGREIKWRERERERE